MRLNRSAPFVANTRQTSSWCSLRMFTVNLPAASIRGHVVDTFDAQNSTSGGSRDTEVNELAETPMGSFPSIAVMIVTPVAKCPRTARKDASSGGMSVSALSDSLIQRPRACRDGRSLRDDGAQLDGSAFASCEHLEPTRNPFGEGAAVQVHEVDRVVRVRGAVMEQHQPTRPRHPGDMNGVVHSRVPEVTLVLELLTGVLRVVDQHVAAVGQVEDLRRDEVVGVVRAPGPVVGHIRHRVALEVHPEPDRRARVPYPA